MCHLKSLRNHGMRSPEEYAARSKMKCCKNRCFQKIIYVCFADGLNLNDVDAVMPEVHTFSSAYMDEICLEKCSALSFKKVYDVKKFKLLV